MAGHSDGDAVAHALIDAVLGAAGAGDVGQHFPPSEARWKGADSLDLLDRAVDIVVGMGFRVINVDAVVVCETPKIGPHASPMRERLAGVLRIPPSAVSVKGKTNEGMGWIGSGEGVAVHAVACLAEDGGGPPRMNGSGGGTS